MKRNVKKVVLAYSGGLDTSIIIPWLKENYDGAEVIGVLRRRRPGRRLRGGAQEGARDRRQQVHRQGPARRVRARLLLQGARGGRRLRGPLPARHGARASAASPITRSQAAIREGADALAHGATGKGNDQVRFEVTFAAFAPHLTRDRSLARVEHPLARGRARLRPQARRAGRPDARRTSSAATATSGTSRTRAATSRTCGTPRRRGCSSSPSTRSMPPRSRAW